MKKLASIQKLENWIDSYLNFEKTPKKNIFWLDTMRFFCEKFGHPENFAPCFHVAGSKGKGSVSVFIASILDAGGYKTGLYTSPHILDFIERVSSVHGAFESEAYDRAVLEIMEGVQKIHAEKLPGERPITWFELVTLFAFLAFRQAKVDYSVYEVGLGGRLDSTNVISPICSVITPIELEHTEFLGDTLEKIAAEKGGIIKENTLVVIARQQPNVRKVFEKIAEEKHAAAYFFEDWVKNFKSNLKFTSSCIKNNTTKINDSAFFYTCCDNFDKKRTVVQEISFDSPLFFRPIHAELSLLGDFQAENAALASLAVKVAIPEISEEAIEKGLSAARLSGRFEILENPLDSQKKLAEKISGANGSEAAGSAEGDCSERKSFIILDGAHTVNSVRFTMETLNKIFGKNENHSEKWDASESVLHEGIPSKRMLLFACAADKDAKDIAPLFRNSFDEIFLTKPGDVKQSDLRTLARSFDEAGLTYDLDENYKAQIQKALKKAGDEKAVLLVTGSFYLIAEVKKILFDINAGDSF